MSFCRIDHSAFLLHQIVKTMGKGGNKSSKVLGGASKDFKLSHMADAELRKWAKAYNENEEADREVLLATLVSYC